MPARLAPASDDADGVRVLAREVLRPDGAGGRGPQVDGPGDRRPAHDSPQYDRLELASLHVEDEARGVILPSVSEQAHRALSRGERLVDRQPDALVQHLSRKVQAGVSPPGGEP